MRFKKLAIVGLGLLLAAASPPYNLDISHPGDTDIEALFPANERTFRDNLNSYINTEHDIATGFHAFQNITTAAKNALVTPPKGMIVYDTTLSLLQTNTGTPGAPVWTTIGPFSLTLPVTVPNGGSGAATETAHGLLLGQGTSPFTAVAVGTNGQLVIGKTGADPVWFSPFTQTAFVAHGSFTYTPGTNEFQDWVRCVGAGGGASGADGTVNTRASPGGGAGAYSEGIVSVTPGVGVTVTIGLGGTGGTSSNGAGGNGTDSSFGSSIIAKAGSGAGAPSQFGTSGGAGGLASGGTGTVKFSGGDGGFAVGGQGTTPLPTGMGGGSAFGSGGQASANNGTVAGSGGGGVHTTSGQAGGSGADGACIVVALP